MGEFGKYKAAIARNNHSMEVQELQSKIEQLEKEKAELRNKIKSQIELLESASKSRIAYNERERNILKSQADDLEGILRGECE